MRSAGAFKTCSSNKEPPLNVETMATRVEQIVRIPALARGERTIPSTWLHAKRITDVVTASLGLVLGAPVIAAAAAAIALVSPGAPFFAQERVGLGGRPFRMLKLRTMHDGAHLLHDSMREYNEVDGPVLKIRNDPRLHALGAFLRKTSIDELPNLVNVLRGEMSIVGPRPPLPDEVSRYDDFARRRLSVKPGLTCYWQVMGRSRIGFPEWMVLDNKYVDDWTPWGDLAIMVRTIPAVISGDGAH